MMRASWDDDERHETVRRSESALPPRMSQSDNDRKVVLTNARESGGCCESALPESPLSGRRAPAASPRWRPRTEHPLRPRPRNPVAAQTARRGRRAIDTGSGCANKQEVVGSPHGDVCGIGAGCLGLLERQRRGDRHGVGGDGHRAGDPVPGDVQRVRVRGPDQGVRWTLNPNVTIEAKKAATSNEARDNLNTRLAAGSGASDIEAIEVDWLPELSQYPDKFVDLNDPAVEGRWLDWKVAQATTADGKLLGYGTDIGPEGICYRADLFEKAGLPTDREEVADAARWRRRHVGEVLRGRRAVHRDGHRGGLVRQRRRDLPGHDQPGARTPTRRRTARSSRWRTPR